MNIAVYLTVERQWKVPSVEGYVKSLEKLLPTYACASHCISLPNDDFHKARRRVYIAVERPSGMVIW